MGEIQLKEGVEPPKKQVKQKRIWWRVLLAFLGGFIFFPLSVVGAAALVGTVFTTKQVVEMAGGNADEILGVQYQNMTILQTVQTLIQTKFETLEDLNNVSPMIEKLITETINPALDEYIHFTFNWDELKTKSFTGEGDSSEIGDYIQQSLTEGIKLVDFIEGSDDLKGVFNYFLYDVARDDSGNVVYDTDGNVTIDKNSPYSIADFMSGADFLNQVMDYIKIGDVVDVTSSSPKILQTMQNWRIGNIEEKINTMEIGSLFTDAELADNTLLNAIKTWTLSDMSDQDKINGLTLSQLLGDDIAEGTILYTFKDNTLTEIKEKDMDNMLLSDILDESAYTNPTNPNYNKTIAAIMENERHDRFVASGAADYETWKAADPENAKFKATVGTLTASDSVEKLKLEDVIDNTGGNKVVEALFDKGATVGNLSATVNDLTIEEVMEIEEGSLLDYPSVRTTKISNSGDLITNIKNNADLSRVVDVDNDSPMILKTLTDFQGLDPVTNKPIYGTNGVKISGIEAKLKTLTLKEVINIDTTDPDTAQILIALKDTQVFGEGTNNLEYKMNNLKFNDVFTEDQCEDSGILMSLWKNNANGNFLISEIGDKMDNIGLLDVLEDKVYENPAANPEDPDYHVMSYTWWFLLTEETEYGTWTPAQKEGRVLPNTAAANDYTVSDFDKLVVNMQYHMRVETVQTLYDAGFIVMDPSKLATYGTYTLEDVMNALP